MSDQDDLKNKAILHLRRETGLALKDAWKAIDSVVPGSTPEEWSARAVEWLLAGEEVQNG